MPSCPGATLFKDLKDALLMAFIQLNQGIFTKLFQKPALNFGPISPILRALFFIDPPFFYCDMNFLRSLPRLDWHILQRALKWLSESLAIGLLRGLAYLPYGWIARFGAALGVLLYQLPSQRKQIIQKNLALCFPEWSSEHRERVAARHFQHAIRSFVERSVQWFAPASKLEKLVQIESQVDLADPNLPPTIFLGYHFVGLEAGALFLNYSLHRPCGAAFQPLTNARIDVIAKKSRSRFGATMLPRTDSARALLRMLHKRMPVMLSSDMDHGVGNSIFVPFFGVPACTLTSISRLAKAAQAQVAPFVCEVLPNYRGYKLRIFAPWDHYPSDNLIADTRRMNAVLEEQIARIPEQYYWLHRRFKTRPAGEAGLY